MIKGRFFLAFFLIASAVVIFSGQQVIEEIVAVINDDIITFSQYSAELEAITRVLRSQLQGEELEKQLAAVRENLLETMITDLLFLQEAKKRDFNVEEQLKMWLENLKKDNNIESDEELIRAMRQQGLDFEQIKKQMRENILKQGVIYAEVQSKIVIDDSEIVNYYKLHPEEFTELPEYKLRAVYISEEGRSEEEVEAKKRLIGEKISSGQDFASLSTEYSEGPEKETQGDLGRFKKGELEKSLEQAVESLKPGEMTPWLKIREGWYLLKLEEKKESRLKPFEEARGSIEEKFFNERRQQKLDEYLKNLKERSYIRIFRPDLYGDH